MLKKKIKLNEKKNNVVVFTEKDFNYLEAMTRINVVNVPETLKSKDIELCEKYSPIVFASGDKADKALNFASEIKSISKIILLNPNKEKKADYSGLDLNIRVVAVTNKEYGNYRQTRQLLKDIQLNTFIMHTSFELNSPLLKEKIEELLMEVIEKDIKEDEVKDIRGFFTYAKLLNEYEAQRKYMSKAENNIKVLIDYKSK